MVIDLLKYRWCRTCKILKPPRTHHCSLCNICVLRMDHHCPWVGNCVGIKNHKFFVQFLFYTTFGCAYVSLTMGIFTSNNFSYVGNGHRKSPYGRVNWSDKQSLTMASILSIALCIAISLLLFTHLFFIFSSQSSIESGRLQDYNPFF